MAAATARAGHQVSMAQHRYSFGLHFDLNPLPNEFLPTDLRLEVSGDAWLWQISNFSLSNIKGRSQLGSVGAAWNNFVLTIFFFDKTAKQNFNPKKSLFIQEQIILEKTFSQIQNIQLWILEHIF